MAETWELEIRRDSDRWEQVSWYIARSWSGKVRLNGQPWYGPSALLGLGLPNPYKEEIR